MGKPGMGGSLSRAATRPSHKRLLQRHTAAVHASSSTRAGAPKSASPRQSRPRQEPTSRRRLSMGLASVADSRSPSPPAPPSVPRPNERPAPLRKRRRLLSWRRSCQVRWRGHSSNVSELAGSGYMVVTSTCSLRTCLQHLPLKMPRRQSLRLAQHAITLGLAPQHASHPRHQPSPAHTALTSLVDTTLTAHSMSLPVLRHSFTLPKEPRPSVSTTMYCGAGQAQQAGWKRMALDRTAAVSAAQRVRLDSPVVHGRATQWGRGSTCSDIAARVVQLEETKEGPCCTTIITTQLPVHRDPSMLLSAAALALATMPCSANTSPSPPSSH